MRERERERERGGGEGRGRGGFSVQEGGFLSPTKVSLTVYIVSV